MDLFWNPWVIHFVEPAAKAMCHALLLVALIRRAHIAVTYPWFMGFVIVQCVAVACEIAGWTGWTQSLWLTLIPLKIMTFIEIVRRLTHFDAQKERSGIIITGLSIGTFVVVVFATLWSPWPAESWPTWIVAARLGCDVILMFATVCAAIYFQFAFYVVARPPTAAHAWIFAAFMATALFKAVPIAANDRSKWWVLNGLAIIWQCACLIAWRCAIQTPKFGTRAASASSEYPTPSQVGY